MLIPGGRRVRLAPGRHDSPREGVCVIELASLLAGEEFSDRPRCVCVVLASFLRGWNDRAPHAKRQRLAPYAARVVGSRASRRVTIERRDRCLEWAGATMRRGPIRRLFSLARFRLRIAVLCGLRAALRLNQGAGDYAARVAIARGSPEDAFRLLEALLAIGGTPKTNGSLNGHGTMSGNGSANGTGATNGNGALPRSRSRVATRA